MDSDLNGCSTCQKGQENYEKFYNKVMKLDMIQYDYRNEDGDLFTTVAPTLEEARRKRDRYFVLLGKPITNK